MEPWKCELFTRKVYRQAGSFPVCLITAIRKFWFPKLKLKLHKLRPSHIEIKTKERFLFFSVFDTKKVFVQPPFVLGFFALILRKKIILISTTR